MRNELLEQIKRELEETKTNQEKDHAEILTDLINKYVPTIQKKDTNHIYIYLGSFKTGLQGKLIFINREEREKFADFSMYQDLEQTQSIRVPISKATRFEQKHFVLIPEEYSDDFNYYEELQKMQVLFLMRTLKSSQEKAKDYLARVYKKKES